MNTELPYKISRLLIVWWSGVITTEEEQELQDWRKENEENEALFQRVVQGEGFKNYLNMHAEYDFRPKFARLENKMKHNRRRRVLKRLCYAAAILPFIVAGILLWQRTSSFPESQQIEHITPGRSIAVLTMGNGRKIALESGKEREKLDSNVIAICDTLEYSGHGGEQAVELHTLSVPRGGEFFLKLSDGTKVWMNSESELQYFSDFVGNERKVFLKGEAYFEVERDTAKPFIVVSGKQEIRVLGTSFCVRAYEEEQMIFTTLEKGSVRVQTGENKVVLQPGEQSVVKDGNIEVCEVNTLQYTAWRTGKYIFTDQPLGDIMTTLARWYDLNVFFTSSDLDKIRFTGELVRYTDVAELLRKFEILEKVKFEIKGKMVIISEY